MPTVVPIFRRPAAPRPPSSPPPRQGQGGRHGSQQPLLLLQDGIDGAGGIRLGLGGRPGRGRGRPPCLLGGRQGGRTISPPLAQVGHAQPLPDPAEAGGGKRRQATVVAVLAGVILILILVAIVVVIVVAIVLLLPGPLLGGLGLVHPPLLLLPVALEGELIDAIGEGIRHASPHGAAPQIEPPPDVGRGAGALGEVRKLHHCWQVRHGGLWWWWWWWWWGGFLWLACGWLVAGLGWYGAGFVRCFRFPGRSRRGKGRGGEGRLEGEHKPTPDARNGYFSAARRGWRAQVCARNNSSG